MHELYINVSLLISGEIERKSERVSNICMYEQNMADSLNGRGGTIP